MVPASECLCTMPRPYTYSRRAKAPERSDISAPQWQSRALILVVDDDLDTLDILRWFLHGAGFDVKTARNGPEALRIVEERVPQVAIIDYMMPGMNGIALCRCLRERPATSRLPVILHTAVDSLMVESEECI